MTTETLQYYTVMEIFAAALSRWKLFLAISFTGLMLSFVLLSTADKQYEASAMITRATPSGGKSSLPRYSSLTGLAASLIGGGSTRMNFLDVMRSEELARTLVEKHDMSKTLFGGLWNEERQMWDMSKLSATGKLRRGLRGLLNMPVPDRITAWNVQKWLVREITVIWSEDKTAWTLKIRQTSPERALDVLQKVIFETEKILVDRRLRELKQQIRFYKQLLAELTNRDLRFAAVASLSQLQKEVISLNSGVAYGAEIVYGPQATDFPVTPVASMFILVGIFLSGLTAFLAAAITGIVAPPKRPRP